MADFTVVLKQSGTVAQTTRRATYQERDGRITASIYLDVTAAGTASNAVKITPTGLPAPLTYSRRSLGTGEILGGSTYYVGAVRWDGTDITFQRHNVANVAGVDSITLASGDRITATFEYEAA
jgi:fermentation-respiration switch protein FrsA (DUF1100 family)